MTSHRMHHRPQRNALPNDGGAVNGVKKMYGQLPKEIAERTDIPMGAKVIYALLSMHKNPETGQCNPSQTTLANECGVKQSSVCYFL